MEHEHTVLTNSFSPNQWIVWNDVPKSDSHSVPLLKFLPEEALAKYKGGRDFSTEVPTLTLRMPHLHITPALM